MILKLTCQGGTIMTCECLTLTPIAVLPLPLSETYGGFFSRGKAKVTALVFLPMLSDTSVSSVTSIIAVANTLLFGGITHG